MCLWWSVDLWFLFERLLAAQVSFETVYIYMYILINDSSSLDLWDIFSMDLLGWLASKNYFSFSWKIFTGQFENVQDNLRLYRTIFLAPKNNSYRRHTPPLWRRFFSPCLRSVGQFLKNIVLLDINKCRFSQKFAWYKNSFLLSFICTFCIHLLKTLN